MKKAGSATGAEGFTLVETLLAILILSSGILFLAPALFKSGAVVAHAACGYQAELLAGNLIAQKEEDLRKYKQINQADTRSETLSGGVSYLCEMKALPQDRLGRLYLVTVRISWKDMRQNQIVRTAYILQ